MLRPLLFPILLTVIYLFGSLVAVPFHYLLTPALDIPLHKTVGFTVKLTGLLLGFLYLRLLALPASAAFGVANKGIRSPLLRYFLAGMLLVFLVDVSLYLLDINQLSPKLYDRGVAGLVLMLIKGISVGLVVSLMEEIIFRGTLYSGLHKQSGAISAIVITATLYSITHFIKFPALPPGQEVALFTGWELLGNAFTELSQPGTIGASISLFALGILFGIVRWHTQSLIPCIGLHIAIITGHKLNLYVTDYNPENSYAWLVNGNYNHLGLLTSGWFCLAISAYLFRIYKKRYI